ncbi:MAG: exonuclease subunit SbcD [Bacteroidales bacterium]|nr:exonuclease subunit SbcD [Bacteroidales bacterium]
MKILHTSDWHIGHKLYGNDRFEEHRLFFDWLSNTIQKQQIDVLLVCGDIFDVGYPSNLALKTYYQLLKDLIKTNLRKVIIIGGNHDFVSTLEAPREILEVLNVSIVGGASGNLSDEIIEIKNDDGSIELVVAAVPYLREKDVRIPVAGETYDDRIKAIRRGIVKHYTDLAGLAQKYFSKKIPVIATGHLYMQGSKLSESERDIHLGNLAGVSAGEFPSNFAYYALGHIHRPQSLASDPPVIYSGSPIALSYSEQFNKKSVRIIEFTDGKLSHEKFEIPAIRKLKSFEGSFVHLPGMVKNYTADSLLPDWLELNIVEEDYNPLLARETQAFVETMNAESSEFQIIRHSLNFTNKKIPDYLLEDAGKSLSEMNETEVFERLLQRQGVVITNDLMQSFKELLEIVHSTEKID